LCFDFHSYDDRDWRVRTSIDEDCAFFDVATKVNEAARAEFVKRRLQFNKGHSVTERTVGHD
jgi:hypothetical protein